MASLPVLLICGCKKYRPYLDVTMKRNANPGHWLTVGLLGDPTAPEARIESASQPDSHLLIVPTPDTYEALPAKIYAAVEWIHKTWPQVPGIFKTDDDIYFEDLPLLERAIDIHRDKPYWGVFVETCEEDVLPYSRVESRFTDTSPDREYRHQGATYCYGHGYWISAASIPIVVAAKEVFASSVLEDVCMGYVLNKAGIMPNNYVVPYWEVYREPPFLRDTWRPQASMPWYAKLCS